MDNFPACRDATHLSIGRALLEDPRGLPLLVAAPVVHGVPATAADLERGPTTSTTSSDTAAKSSSYEHTNSMHVLTRTSPEFIDNRFEAHHNAREFTRQETLSTDALTYVSKNPCKLGSVSSSGLHCRFTEQLNIPTEISFLIPLVHNNS